MRSAGIRIVADTTSCRKAILKEIGGAAWAALSLSPTPSRKHKPATQASRQPCCQNFFRQMVQNTRFLYLPFTRQFLTFHPTETKGLRLPRSKSGMAPQLM